MAAVRDVQEPSVFVELNENFDSLKGAGIPIPKSLAHYNATLYFLLYSGYCKYNIIYIVN